ncbi:hypothetical protein [Kitasatospora aureofaciens]|uniref:hypothetical protein n=1 Tax=Kitasatospora aureofaciens TaxID=1894 RepID=UPI0033C1B347
MHLGALQFVQTSTLAAAELASAIPLDPKTTTPARRTAIALGHAHTRVVTATQQLSVLFQHSLSADVWAMPETQPVNPAEFYTAAQHQLAAAARELRIEADRLPAAGTSHVPAQARPQAARSIGQRLRGAFGRRPAEPAAPTALPRSSTTARR